MQASKKFVLLKGVVATILLQQFAVNAALSMEVIPEGDYGYTAEDRAKRMYCTLTIMEMAVFSLLLSYSFSHTSMTLPDASAGLKGGSKGGSKAQPMRPPTGSGPPHTATAFFLFPLLLFRTFLYLGCPVCHVADLKAADCRTCALGTYKSHAMT